MNEMTVTTKTTAGEAYLLEAGQRVQFVFVCLCTVEEIKALLQQQASLYYTEEVQ